MALLLAAAAAFAQNPVPLSEDRSLEPAPETQAAAPQNSEFEVAQREPMIGPGDLIEVRVFGAPELTQEVRINASGEAMFALIGPVRIGGLTQFQAQKTLEAKLKDGGFLRDPHVTLFTKDYASQGVSVLGEVQRPGVYPVLGPRRLFDVLSLAGGSTQRAGKMVTVTHRSDPDKPTQVEISTDPSKSLANNVEIFPGDTVVVSRAGVIYVVGSVARPSGFTMDNNERLTVLEAIALAGGTSSTAALNNAKILRKNANGVEEIATPLKPILSAKSQDVPLKPGDILFVPDSKTKGFARRGLESAIQITTGLAIYRR